MHRRGENEKGFYHLPYSIELRTKLNLNCLFFAVDDRIFIKNALRGESESVLFTSVFSITYNHFAFTTRHHGAHYDKLGHGWMLYMTGVFKSVDVAMHVIIVMCNYFNASLAVLSVKNIDTV